MNLFRFLRWVGQLGCLLLPGVLWADTFVLRDGRRLEGVAQEEGEELVITTYSGEVVRVSRKDVMGSTKEPVRNEFYARLKALPAADAQACFALGQWAAERKLTADAQMAFERALAIDPRHEGALKALRRSPPAAGVPTGEGAVVIAPAVHRPEQVEQNDMRALAKRLADLKDGQAAETQALVALAKERPELFARILKPPAKPGETQIRLRAVQSMGLAGDRRAMDPLLSACFEEPDENVRRATAKALAQLEEPVALRKLLDVATAPKFPWATRQRACAILRYYGDPEAVERLLSGLSFELAGGNPRDPRNPLLKSPAGLGGENALGIQEDNLPVGPVDERMSYPVLYALKEVTGASFNQGEKEYRTWQQWWREKRAAFRFPQ